MEGRKEITRMDDLEEKHERTMICRSTGLECIKCNPGACGHREYRDEVVHNNPDCPWCHGGNRSQDNFSVFDESFGQFVHPRMVKFCPFCGVKMK